MARDLRPKFINWQSHIHEFKPQLTRPKTKKLPIRPRKFNNQTNHLRRRKPIQNRAPNRDIFNRFQNLRGRIRHKFAGYRMGPPAVLSFLRKQSLQ